MFSMPGKIFSRLQIEILSSFPPKMGFDISSKLSDGDSLHVSIGHNVHEMSDPVFLEICCLLNLPREW